MNQKERVSTLDGTTQVNAEILTNLHTLRHFLRKDPISP